MCMWGQERDSKICESCAESLLQAGRQTEKGFSERKTQQTHQVLVSLQEHLDSESGCITPERETVRFGLCHDAAMI